METKHSKDVGLYYISARISLVKYQKTVFREVTFTVEVLSCTVTEMQQEMLPEQFYNVYTPTHSFALKPFTITPACGYELEYAIKLKNVVTGVYAPLPDWIINTGGLTFSVQTNDPVNVAMY